MCRMRCARRRGIKEEPDQPTSMLPLQVEGACVSPVRPHPRGAKQYLIVIRLMTKAGEEARESQTGKETGSASMLLPALPMINE